MFGIYSRFIAPVIHKLFFRDLVWRTNNFAKCTWLGNPIWQNTLDLWTIQETLAEIKPALLIETGTNKGGSSLYYAHLFDLMNHGEIITVDVEKLHNHQHPRITYLLGSSTGAEVLSVVGDRAAKANGPVMVILDSDHSEHHVYQELLHYTPWVTPGSFCLVQDGSIDELHTFSAARPGPLPAIKKFLAENNAFNIDHERCRRFLITHHPLGWLRKSMDERPSSKNTI